MKSKCIGKDIYLDVENLSEFRSVMEKYNISIGFDFENGAIEIGIPDYLDFDKNPADLIIVDPKDRSPLVLVWIGLDSIEFMTGNDELIYKVSLFI